MTENTEWNEELKKKLDALEQSGVDISEYKGIKTKEEYEAKQADINRQIEGLKVNTPEVKQAENKNTGNDGERTSLTVGGDNTQTDDLQWIEEKRKFWKEYAAAVENAFENDEKKDIESKSFVCALTKDKDHGEITYTSPTNAQISKDSHLVMYQGLVKDALKNNLTITFGQSLDDKQKAMLLAACLLEQGTYGNGDKIAMVNPPKIDMNAEYMKDMPEDVKKVLETYAKQQEIDAKQQEARKKLEELKQRRKENNEAEAKTPEEQKEIMKERRQILKDQYAAMKETLTPEQAAAREQKETDREKIMAARLGITGAYTTKDTKGNERVVTEEKGLSKEKDSNGHLRVPKYVQEALAQKYGKSK